MPLPVPDVYLPPQSMNIGTMMQRRAAELAERRARRENEYDDSDFESHDDYRMDSADDYHTDSDHDMDVRGRRDYDYSEEDRQQAVFFRREQDALDIARMERAVQEASRALDEAKHNLRETKIRIRDRRREERQQLKESSRLNRGVSQVVGPFADNVYERVSQQSTRDYLSPAGNGSRPPTPRPSSSGLPTRSRSPSPYRFSSRTESEIPTLPSQASQSVHESQPPSHTLNPALHEGEGSDTVPAQEQVYHSFNKLHDLAKEFQTLKQNFVYPSVLEFQKPGSEVGDIITVRARSPPAEFEDDQSKDGVSGSGDPRSEGKLAYTRANEAFHIYAHAMEKLLGKLDSVDSWNETSVRNRRRGIIGEIEQEASKLERYREKVWHIYLAQEDVKRG